MKQIFLFLLFFILANIQAEVVFFRSGKSFRGEITKKTSKYIYLEAKEEQRTLKLKRKYIIEILTNKQADLINILRKLKQKRAKKERFKVRYKRLKEIVQLYNTTRSEGNKKVILWILQGPFKNKEFKMLLRYEKMIPIVLNSLDKEKKLRKKLIRLLLKEIQGQPALLFSSSLKGYLTRMATKYEEQSSIIQRSLMQSFLLKTSRNSDKIVLFRFIMTLDQKPSTQKLIRLFDATEVAFIRIKIIQKIQERKEEAVRIFLENTLKASYEKLNSKYNNSEKKLFIATLSALLNIKSQKSVPVIIETLQIERYRIRKVIARVLKTLTGVFVGSTYKNWKEWLENQEQHNEKLQTLMESDSKNKHLRAIRAANDLEVITINDLIKYLVDKKESVRTIARYAIIRIAKKKYSQELFNALERLQRGIEDENILFDVVLAFAGSNPKRTWEILQKSYENDTFSEKFAIRILQELGRYQTKKNCKYHLELLGSIEDKKTIILLINNLGSMKIQQAIPELIPYLSNEDEQISKAAHKALKKISGKKIHRSEETWKNWWQNK